MLFCRKNAHFFVLFFFFCAVRILSCLGDQLTVMHVLKPTDFALLQGEIAPFLSEDFYMHIQKEVAPLISEFTDPAFLYKITHGEEIKQAERKAFLEKVIWQGALSRNGIKVVVRTKDLIVLSKGLVRLWMDYGWYRHFYDAALPYCAQLLLQQRDMVYAKLMHMHDRLLVAQATGADQLSQPRADQHVIGQAVIDEFVADQDMVKLFTLPYARIMSLYGSQYFKQRLVAGCMLAWVTNYHAQAGVSSAIAHPIARFLIDWQLDTQDRIPSGLISACSQMMMESSWQPKWARGLRARWSYEIVVGCVTLYVFHQKIVIPRLLKVLVEHREKFLKWLDPKKSSDKHADEALAGCLQQAFTASFFEWLHDKRSVHNSFITLVDLVFSLPGWYCAAQRAYEMGTIVSASF